MADGQSDLKDAIERLSREVALLNSHRFVRMHDKPRKMLMFQFLRGMAFGLGSVVGATILVSLLAWWLSQIEFLPIVGQWARQIADEIGQIR
ncbi:hypothetical protein SAMN05216196_10383 [Lutimaribacter pacificus]|uniref:Uncharacterized protein n=1 Tax=Lutimaribacter pacificus TaxID=391948 RepID=A0A1H0G3X8_9RHOB|nr:DUF5665 domain-containing protein [Lutimaribacter pacificus]SDO01597.1 hypothetical protein SAMN05216196_10383 [Lutimaribacter pacificus]SHJ84721.1 hypothetical protein SAMN05444142_10284 [Lutimaribacter pacificus]